MMREQAIGEAIVSVLWFCLELWCPGAITEFSVIPDLQERWRRRAAAVLGPCAWCADLQGQTSPWDLNINSNQRACLVFGAARM